jgi:hypothetical protein
MDDATQHDIAAAQLINLELIRRFLVVPVKQPNAVTWTVEAWRRASFWPATPAA